VRRHLLCALQKRRKRKEGEMNEYERESKILHFKFGDKVLIEFV
jgi:hypothetical protein